MEIHVNIKYICFALFITVFILISCNEQGNLPFYEPNPKAFVINEIMPANQTGLMADNGKIYDWIEIKNISDDTESLGNITLVVEENEKDKNGKQKIKSAKLPDRELAPGECVVIFADKKGKKHNGKTLFANVKLPADGAKVKLMMGNNNVFEVNYPKMENDQSYRRREYGNFEASCLTTPGFDNNEDGFEQYLQVIEQQRKEPVKIWETHLKGFNRGTQWIEIKNVSDSVVNIKDYCLATERKHIDKWQLPDVNINPGAFYIIDCRKNNFKIGDKATVILSKNGMFVDGVSAFSAPYGTSVGRKEYYNGFFYFESPTKGKENTTHQARFIQQKPEFLTHPGVYPNIKAMKVAIDTHGQKMHYTTDGSIPNEKSPIYNDSITIDKTTTIRAFCNADSNAIKSPVVTATFIFADKHSLPVVNITVNHDDIFDFNHGIYADGPGKGTVYPYHNANFWKKWWKKAHIEFIDSIQGFSEDCEIAIFGGFSRALAKKSFKIRFKDYLGASFVRYDFFDNGKPLKLKKFILRSGSQDINGVMVRDEFFTSLMKQQCTELLIQDYRPVALYINGEYFGLYYIREKIDNRFVARKLHVSNDSISIIMAGKYTEEGSIRGYNEIINFAKNHDMTQKQNYDFVADRFDVQALIDYKLGEMYSNNVDVGNVRYVHANDSKGDKKWHIVFYDIDLSWTASKPASFYFKASGSNAEGSVSGHNILIQQLLKNSEFRQLFLERLSLLMHKTFSTENATATFDNIINTIKPEMPRNCQRWPQVMAYSTWENHVDEFRKKFKDRPKNMLNSLRQELNITEEENKKYFNDLNF